MTLYLKLQHQIIHKKYTVDNTINLQALELYIISKIIIIIRLYRTFKIIIGILQFLSYFGSKSFDGP